MRKGEGGNASVPGTHWMICFSESQRRNQSVVVTLEDITRLYSDQVLTSMLTLNSSAGFSMSITVMEDPIATAKQVNATTMVRSLGGDEEERK